MLEKIFSKNKEISFKVKIEVSARHIHLCADDLKSLFGVGYELKAMKALSQTGEFAAEEKVDLKTKKGILKNVRIIGPVRKKTQVEISLTDGYYLGIEPPVRLSGETGNTPGVEIIGPMGNVNILEGVIVAKRHVHCGTQQAQRMGIEHGQKAKVKINGERGLIFDNVIIRVDDKFDLSFQIDTDEANAAGIDLENNMGEVAVGI